MTAFWTLSILGFALLYTAYGDYPMQPNSQNIANLFFRSRLSNQDPAVSMACFRDYMVESNENSQNYSTNYNQCLVDAKSTRLAIEKEMKEKRIKIEHSSQGICQRLTMCNGYNTTLEIFNCHAKFGANNTKEIYGISNNSSEYASHMQEQYRIMGMRSDKCCKSAERSFVEASGRVYITLQNCLDGRTKPQASTTTTTTTTTSAPGTTPSFVPTPTVSIPTPTTANPGTTPENVTTPPTTYEIFAAAEGTGNVTEQFSKLLNLFR